MKLSSVKRRIVIALVNHVFAGTRFFEIKRCLLNGISWHIGEGTRIVGPMICTGTLFIGKDCWIGKNMTVHGNGEVIIGDNCDIAPDVTFLTGGHQIGTHSRRAGKGENYCIYIGNGTWIGARATFTGNTRIGEGCVIAAMACVTKDILPDTLAGGVPARPIRRMDDESEAVHA